MTLDIKEIRGLNLKQIIAYTIAVGAIMGTYFDIRSEIQTSRRMIETIQQMAKEDKQQDKEDQRLSRVQMQTLEASQAAINLRLTILETELNERTKK